MQKLQRLPKLVTSLLAAAGLAGSMLVGGPALSHAQTTSCSYGCDVGESYGQLTARYSSGTITVSGVGTLSREKWRKVYGSYDVSGTSRSIVFEGAADGSKIALPADSSYLFSPLESSVEQANESIYRIYLPDNLDTSQVTNMRGIFASNLYANPNVANWDTSQVTDMKQAFGWAYGAKPDVSKWDVSQVRDMSAMFVNTAANVDVSNWDTGQVTDMSSMFAHYDTTMTPDVSAWDTSNVTDMSNMFFASNHIDPDVSRWNTSKVTNMGGMFQWAGRANPDVSNWNVSKVTNTDFMFAFLSTDNIADPDISHWEYRSLTSVDSMFCNNTGTKWKSTSLGKQLKECGESTVSYDGTGKDKGMMSPAVIGTVTVIALLLLALGAAGQMGLLPLVMPRP